MSDQINPEAVDENRADNSETATPEEGAKTPPKQESVQDTEQAEPTPQAAEAEEGGDHQATSESPLPTDAAETAQEAAEVPAEPVATGEADEEEGDEGTPETVSTAPPTEGEAASDTAPGDVEDVIAAAEEAAPAETEDPAAEGGQDLQVDADATETPAAEAEQAEEEEAVPAEAEDPAAEGSQDLQADTDATKAPAAEAEQAEEEEATTEKKGRRKRGRKGGKGRRKLESFTPEEELTGTVRSIQPYGAFVDVGAERDGLVHISELRDGFVEKVEDVVKENNQVTVRVKEVDTKKGRLSLTMRSSEALAAESEDKQKRVRLRDLAEGQELTGTVTSVVDFGAFVDISANTDGLIHISELSDERVNRVNDVVEEGQEVTVRILSIDKRRNRISLTMREQINPEEFTYDEEETDELPSTMELAFARARERTKKEKRSKKGNKQQDSEIDDIIARTLNRDKE